MMYSLINAGNQELPEKQPIGLNAGRKQALGRLRGSPLPAKRQGGPSSMNAISAANGADLLERFLEASGRAQAAESQQKHRREPEIAKNRNTG